MHKWRNQLLMPFLVISRNLWVLASGIASGGGRYGRAQAPLSSSEQFGAMNSHLDKRNWESFCNDEEDMVLSATPNEDDDAPWPGLLLLDAEAAAADAAVAALVCRLGTANLSTYR